MDSNILQGCEQQGAKLLTLFLVGREERSSIRL